MNNKLRRFEVLLPLQFNDGSPVPGEWISEAICEIVDCYGAASFETQEIEGFWRQEGKLYRDNLSRLVVDIPDTASNRQWMKKYKQRWKKRFGQLELWMVSYPVDIE